MNSKRTRGRLIGYLRLDDCDHDLEEQEVLIRTFCQWHSFDLMGFASVDRHGLGDGYTEAFSTTGTCDGIIAVDLSRFFSDEPDRIDSLRRLAESLERRGKILVTVMDGIETMSEQGRLHFSSHIGAEWIQGRALAN